MLYIGSPSGAGSVAPAARGRRGVRGGGRAGRGRRGAADSLRGPPAGSHRQRERTRRICLQKGTAVVTYPIWPPFKESDSFLLDKKLLKRLSNKYPVLLKQYKKCRVRVVYRQSTNSMKRRHRLTSLSKPPNWPNNLFTIN